MRHHIRWIIIAATALVTAGCLPERDGPSGDDNGATLFWELHQFDTIYDECSDDPASIARVEAPEFEENSFFVYELSDDGTEAVVRSCTRTEASSCTEFQPRIAMTREDGNVYVWDPVEVAIGAGGAGCEVLTDERWAFTDDGETGNLDVSVTFNLLGDACPAYDDQVKENSPNGLGVNGCTVTIRAELDHFRTD